MDVEQQTKPKERPKKNKNTVEERVLGSVEHLTDEFGEAISKELCRHVYNNRHQYRGIRELKQGLIKKDEMIFHINFSGNYGLKYNMEVQSVHFGAPNAQVTHKCTQGFCTLKVKLQVLLQYPAVKGTIYPQSGPICNRSSNIRDRRGTETYS